MQSVHDPFSADPGIDQHRSLIGSYINAVSAASACYTTKIHVLLIPCPFVQMYFLQNRCCCQPQIDRTFEIRCLFADFSKYHLFCGHYNLGSVSDVRDVPHRPHKYTRSRHRSRRNVLPAKELPPRPQTAHMPFVFPDKRQFECILSLPDERSHLTWQAFPDLQTRLHPALDGAGHL